MKAREYCCCGSLNVVPGAIPLVNAGIYFTLIEQFVLGILVGAISLATPSIVGAVTPSFASWVLGIICFVGAAVQVLGFIGVAREKSILFRRYVSLHSLIIVAAFSVSLAWIILSLTRHSTAKSNCIANFFANANSELASEGKVLCEIFPWVGAGVMGGLWLILVAVHIYLYVVISGYSSAQQRDHAQYDSLNQSTTFRSENVALKSNNDAYDSRYSTDVYQPRVGGTDYGHLRKDSTASMSDVLAEPMQQPTDMYRQGSYPQRQPSLPANAYTQDEIPTPKVGASYYSQSDRTLYSGDLEKPALSQAHPAEGSFGRKTPRLTKERPFDDGFR